MRSLSVRAEPTAGAAHGCQARDADLHPGRYVGENADPPSASFGEWLQNEGRPGHPEFPDTPSGAICQVTPCGVHRPRPQITSRG